jgi:hypothetical protein
LGRLLRQMRRDFLQIVRESLRHQHPLTLPRCRNGRRQREPAPVQPNGPDWLFELTPSLLHGHTIGAAAIDYH